MVLLPAAEHVGAEVLIIGVGGGVSAGRLLKLADEMEVQDPLNAVTV